MPFGCGGNGGCGATLSAAAPSPKFSLCPPPTELTGASNAALRSPRLLKFALIFE